MKKIERIVQKTPFLSTIAVNGKYYKERKLLKNNHTTSSTQKSVIHFSVNKAATQHIKAVLKEISKENELIPVSMNEYAFRSKLPFLDHLTFEEMEDYKHIFKPQGYLYTVFGGFINNVDFDLYNILLTIRDPRDILVSSYYSIAYSHEEPPSTSDKRKDFFIKRKFAREVNIDDYVLTEAPKVSAVFKKYKEFLVDKYEQTNILKYEEMISDYEKWLINLASISGLEMNDNLRNTLISNFERSRVKKENKNVHIRKGIAGDYQNKLKPETIDKLNLQLVEILEAFKYSI